MDNPDVADDCFLLGSRCMRYCGHLLVPTPTFPALLDCALMGMLVQHRSGLPLPAPLLHLIGCQHLWTAGAILAVRLCLKISFRNCAWQGSPGRMCGPLCVPLCGREACKSILAFLKDSLELLLLDSHQQAQAQGEGSTPRESSDGPSRSSGSSVLAAVDGSSGSTREAMRSAAQAALVPAGPTAVPAAHHSTYGGTPRVAH